MTDVDPAEAAAVHNVGHAEEWQKEANEEEGNRRSTTPRIFEYEDVTVHKVKVRSFVSKRRSS